MLRAGYLVKKLDGKLVKARHCQVFVRKRSLEVIEKDDTKWGSHRRTEAKTPLSTIRMRAILADRGFCFEGGVASCRLGRIGGSASFNILLEHLR